MLSIFGIPKPFRGHIDVIQRNAIQSWTLLRPACQVILVGDEYGTKETAEEFGVCHAPDVVLNEFGTPRDNSVLQLAEEAAEHPLMCLVASDVILMGDITQAVERVKSSTDNFAICGQRWNLKVTEPIDFNSTWEEELRSLLALRGRLYVRTGMDYLVYRRGLFGEVPPFSVGRRAYDNWLLYTVRKKGVDLVDATQVIKPVHQDHDYSYRDDNYPTEVEFNTGLAGNRRHHFIIKDRTHVLTPRGLKQTRDLWRCWRFLRTMDALHPSLPAPLLWFGEAINSTIDFVHAGIKFVYDRLGVTPPHERTTGE